MTTAIDTVVAKCQRAIAGPDPQAAIANILAEAAKNPAIADEIAQRTEFANLGDLAVHISPELTVLAGSLPPGFSAAPHNHNLWSVVSVCGGQEDNEFFERDGNGIKSIGTQSVVAPGVLANDADVIHSIRNPLDRPLLALHAYGGNLFATPRSNWDPDTNEEIPFDWDSVSFEDNS